MGFHNRQAFDIVGTQILLTIEGLASLLIRQNFRAKG